jgi:putative membrane protein insertion efficiency factor
LKANSATLSNALDVADRRAGPSPLPRRSIAVVSALTLLRAYKLILSPWFAGSCRFVPSCSDYAAQAIDRFGVLRGTWLGARRLSRCHPFCAGGHDPVPPAC